MAEQDQYDTEFVLHSVGDRLRIAREAAGLSRADIAARTKIAERHLTAIEEDRFDDLASSTYAVGFARAYARTVGLDEADIARQVRSVLEAGEDDVLPAVTFEPGDPARIPTPRLAWFAAVGVIAVVAAIFLFWRSYFTPAVSLPDLTQEEAAIVAAAPIPAPEASLPAPLATDPAAVASTPAVTSAPAVASAPAVTGTAPALPPVATTPRPQQQARPTPRPSPRPTATATPRPAASSAPAGERPPAAEPAPSPAASPAPAAAAAGASAQGDPASTVSP